MPEIVHASTTHSTHLDHEPGLEQIRTQRCHGLIGALAHAVVRDNLIVAQCLSLPFVEKALPKAMTRR